MKKRNNIGVDTLEQAVLVNEILGMMKISKSAKPYYRKETTAYYELSDDGKSETKLSEKELMISFKKLVQGKSETEKEKIIDNMLKSCERSDLPKSIEALYEEEKVNNLTDLAHKTDFDQEAVSAEGLDITDVSVMYVIAITGGAPYYKLEPSNKLYQLFIDYEITPLNENVTGRGKKFTVTENGEYKFKVTTNIGEEILVTVPINEITKTLEEIEEGSNYEIVERNYRFCILKNKETQKYSTFETAFAIYEGKMYDVSEAIECIENEENETNSWITTEGDEIKEIPYSIADVVRIDQIVGEKVGDMPFVVVFKLIIIKDNSCYINDVFYGRPR